MRICRFNNDRVGLVEGSDVIDVSAIIGRMPPARWPFPRGDQFTAMLDTLRPEMEVIARYTLEPGDVFLTGTPEGVAPVEPGNVLHCSMAGIGEMDVLVAPAKPNPVHAQRLAET